ncbi:N-acetylglucosamine-6-phosphate deacetylase [Arenibaculum pallidiluteum]|uniref:N-acetylglucosamine-6-phosphate deacetylase n=1 Tax=Arenibaculum pallidiluteum TaxID=2812559 RepID=UPI001A967487|nr:N-acetylglucosamine-6-phosphate deacetylase [Arenibaculum pallidiluteum]
MRHFLTGPKLFTGDEVIEGHGIFVEEGRIAGVLPVGGDPPAGAQLVPLEPGALIAPGFIDIQVNGGGGVLFNDQPTVEGALAIAAAHRRFGSTGILPTIITDAPERMRDAAQAVVEAVRRPASGVLGIHIEGPFINPERAGAHDRRFIRKPTEDDLAFLCGLSETLQGRVLLTLAPECVEDAALVRLVEAGVAVSVGHTAASAERVAEVLQLGARAFTHLFNAMPAIVNRQPGPAGAALADRGAWAGLIVDGHHVHPTLLRAALAARPRERMLLITDAMPPTGTEQTSFALNGRTIFRRDGRLVLADGTLAGADLDMAAAVRNARNLLGLPLEDALRMASLYPAEFLGMERERGRIAAGYRADLVLLGPEGEVRATWIDGRRRDAGDPGEALSAERR